jgi:serine/threonine protein phosphatase PrpC
LCAQTLDRERVEGGMFEAPAYYHRANAAVTSLGQRVGETSGSTAAVAYLRANRLFVSNVGDSRIYHLRGSALRCLTYDHTRYQQLADSGYAVIDESERHVLTQFLGMGIQRPMSPHFAVSVPLEVGDRILLCSDGLSGTLDDAEIRALLQEGAPEQAGRALVRQAMDAGSMDNITVLIADVCELDEGEDPLSEPWNDAPVTRRFDVPTPDQITEQEHAADRERRREIRKSIWLVILSLLGVLAVSGGIIWLALRHAPERDASAPTTFAVDGAPDFWYHQSGQSLNWRTL